jgi:hypothetical protein
MRSKRRNAIPTTSARIISRRGDRCLYNVAKDETTSATYISGGQLAQTWNLRPDLITLTVGEENTTVINP